MRIFETFAVALVLVLVFAFVLNKKLDAGDRETAKLEKKLETALTAIDRLEKAAKDALKREKELVKRGENLAKQMSAKLKELASLVAADMDQIGEDMKKELVPAMTKLVLPLNKRNRELAAELDRRVREQKSAERLLFNMVISVGKLDSKVAVLEGRTLRVEAHTHTVVGSPLHRKAYPCFPNELCP